MPSLENLSFITCSARDLIGLKKTLNSFRKSPTFKSEIILVLSNYSRNEINQIFQDYQTLNLKIFDKAKSGIYDAMNFGIQKSTKEFFICLNGGDSLYSIENLKKLLSRIQKNGWGYGAIKMTTNNSNSSNRIYRFNPYSLSLNRFGIKFVPHPAVVMSKNLAVEIGLFDTKYLIAADQKLFLLASQFKRPFASNSVISEFSLGGVSSRNSYEITNDFKNISKEIFGPILNNTKIDDKIWKLVSVCRNTFTKN